MAKKPCSHRFQFAWSSGRGAGGRKIKLKLPGRCRPKTVRTVPLTLGFRCSRCGENVAREATPGERKFYGPRVAWERRPNTHTVWHEFMKRFKTKDGSGYLWKGYDFMGRVQKWARRYPKDVRITSIDDSYFAGSILVLVEHKTPRSYMGTTVVVVPQCSGESPLEFFMYPGHRRELLKALRAIHVASKSIEKLERHDRVAEDRALRKNIRHPAVL
jgi:hypothetical protein